MESGFEPPPPEDFADAPFPPPDEQEPPTIDLWSAVGDVPPWGTMLLICSWSVLFAALVFRGELGDAGAYASWGASMTRARPAEAAWRLLASTFLHAGPLHLALNAATMLIFGPAVERVFTRAGFALVFTVGGTLASLASLVWRSSAGAHAASLSVGASGAIFALGGALLAAAARLRQRLAPGRARALGGALLFLIVQGLASGFTQYGTDNAAHAGGLVAGAALGAALPLAPKLGGAGPGRVVRTLGALAALALLGALGMAVWRGVNGS